MIILDYFIIVSIKIKIKNKYINNYCFIFCILGIRFILVDFGVLNFFLINCCLKLFLNLDGVWLKGVRLFYNLINLLVLVFEMIGGFLFFKW